MHRARLESGQRRPPEETKSAELPSRQVDVPLHREQIRSPDHWLSNAVWHLKQRRVLDVS
jgi:hypothetical protein